MTPAPENVAERAKHRGADLGVPPLPQGLNPGTQGPSPTLQAPAPQAPRQLPLLHPLSGQLPLPLEESFEHHLPTWYSPLPHPTQRPGLPCCQRWSGRLRAECKLWRAGLGLSLCALPGALHTTLSSPRDSPTTLRTTHLYCKKTQRDGEFFSRVQNVFLFKPQAMLPLLITVANLREVLGSLLQ